MFYFVRRRQDLAFSGIFILFALFILACGTTHIFGVLSIWQPVYKIDGIVKLLTAGVSVLTAVVLWPLIPRALALPSPTTLRRANESLEREIAERRQVEETLRQMGSKLEKRVNERTAELSQANELLRRENEARKEAEEAERAARTLAEHANRMKDEFFANLSHELRTPLNAILGWAQLLKTGHSVERVSEGLEIIERNARVQSQLIADLLDMSRIVSGKLRLDVQRVDPVTIIESAIESIRPAADAKSIRIEKILDPQAGPVSGDANRLQQVMWNLLSNAIKFTPKGGKVQVLLERVNSHLEITVADTGQGIDPNFLPHLFERFSQADSSATRKHGGLGLGLSIVKHLVELHGGSIRAKSPGPGMGSTFVVCLPIVVAHHGDEPRPHPRVELAESNEVDANKTLLAGLKVLVVDDDPDAARLVSTILEAHGATAIAATSAAEAYEYFVHDQPDILLSDIGMPHEDGYSLLRRIRKLTEQTGSDVPAIALTAFARSQDRTRALLAGFHTHLAKPVDAAELVAVVANATGRIGITEGEDAST